MIRDIELTLLGAPVPNGEIAARDLAALVGALQELTTRVARDAVSAAGPGRSKQFVEEFAELRLRAVDAGSTVLRFAKGPVGKLDVDLPEEAAADDRFWEVLEGIAEDRRPESVTDLVAESAGKLLSALKTMAAQALFATPKRKTVRVRGEIAHLETWAVYRVQVGGVTAFAGWLEKVDLRSHEFRLRDDVGNRLQLTRVRDDAEAAKLVGQWVAAEGQGVEDASGRVVALENARVFAIADPAASYLGGRVVSIDEILASASGPDIDGGIDLSDEEIAEFLRAIRS